MLRFIFIRFSLALFALFPFIIGLSAYILIRYIFAFNYYYYWEYFFYRKRTHKHKGNVIDSIRNMKGIIVIFALSLLIPFPLFCMFGLQSPPPHLWIFCTPHLFSSWDLLPVIQYAGHRKLHCPNKRKRKKTPSNPDHFLPHIRLCCVSIKKMDYILIHTIHIYAWIGSDLAWAY